MSIAEILLPAFVLVALTFALVIWTGIRRVSVIRGGQVRMKDVALGERNWPENVAKVGNAYENQLQMPVLFYLLVALALITRRADFAFVVLSWIFVATRFIHVYLHTGTNYMPHRFYAFLAGVIVLAIMWVKFAFEILSVA